MDKVPLPKVCIPELSGHVHHISGKRRNKNERKKFWCSVGTEKSYKFKELVKCLADLSGRQLWLVSNRVDLLKEIDFLFDVKFRKYKLKSKKHINHYDSFH